MLEVLLYVGLVGVMSVGTLSMYGEYNTKIKRTKALDQLESVAESSKTIFYGRTAGMTAEALNQKLADHKVTLKDPWGNTIGVSLTEDGKCVEVAFVKLSKGDCLGMAMVGRSNCEDGSWRTSVNEAGQAANPSAEYAGTCTDGSNNSVKFFYTK
jgi:hypothetical protein